MAAAVKQSFEEFKTRLEAALKEKNKFTEVLEKIEAKTGVNRVNIVFGALAVVGVYLMIGYGADLLCNVIGFVYPAYASVKAIETKEKDDDTKWLTYWVVYSLFALCEFFGDIFFFWVPFYWFFKCVFLVYCFAPIKNNGSVAIYYRVIRPFVLKHQTKIDEGISKAKSVAGSVINEVTWSSDSNSLELKEFLKPNPSRSRPEPSG